MLFITLADNESENGDGDQSRHLDGSTAMRDEIVESSETGIYDDTDSLMTLIMINLNEEEAEDN